MTRPRQEPTRNLHPPENLHRCPQLSNHSTEPQAFPNRRHITIPQEGQSAEISRAYPRSKNKIGHRPISLWRVAVCDLFRSILLLHSPPRARKWLPTATATPERRL